VAKTPNPSRKGRKAVALLTGKANGPLHVEVRIVDPEYTVEAFSDDIKYQRVWFEGTPDSQGWVKLVYSADGPDGNPWQIGNIRFTFDPSEITSNLQNVTSLSVKPAKE
jgi:hypothetical protein